MKQEVLVEGMKCAGCANTVKERFEGLPNVTTVEMVLEEKKAILDTPEVIKENELKQALEGTNYTVSH